MKQSYNQITKTLSIVFHILITFSLTKAQGVQDFHLPNLPSEVHPIQEMHQFNGYTNHWQDSYTEWHRYGNIFKMATPNVEQNILQSKLDVAEDLQLPGLLMQEGFLKALFSNPYSIVRNPKDMSALSFSEGAQLILVNGSSDFGQSLENQARAAFDWIEGMQSYQLNDSQLQFIKAFYLEHNDDRLFVISAHSETMAESLLQLITNTQNILADYRLEKGWFGASTLLKSVTCQQGHPLDLIKLGMNEGNSWFVFDGYMDFLAQAELDQWVKNSGLSIIADVGFSPIYGCSDYGGLQVQDMATPQAWIDYAHSKGGYAFRQVYHPESDDYDFDGYIVHEGNKTQIDQEDVPFINKSGYLSGDLTSSMILFVDKNQPLTKTSMWDAIMNRKSVAILEKALVMGAKQFRTAIQLLYLDKEFLEDYYDDKVSIQSEMDGYNLRIQISNNSNQKIQGEVVIGESLSIKSSSAQKSMEVEPGQVEEYIFPLQLTKEAMGKTNPITIHVHWDERTKSTVQMMDMPPAISVHQLLYGQAPKVEYPVTVHNFSDQKSFPVSLEVLDENKSAVFTAEKMCNASKGHYEQIIFDLDLEPGSYTVVVKTLGVTSESQLGVSAPEGRPYLYEVDLNSDGINEYRMENDSVQITLLRTGARVIEYIVKSKQDNVLFKIWPEKTYNHKKPFRMRGFYPYGGFEDFLGQASMETHKIYDAKVIQSEGNYVRVEMTAEYYGNHIKKIFTLYGNSPILEVRFALDFHNPEANVLGPQPILELGETHGTEDVFTVPTTNGLVEYRMRPEEYYGQAIEVQEGWNAGYDTQEDISFVGAFPVTQPIFLHMWMNHPRNQEAPHYYVEFQPWTPIIQKTTMYFSYYLRGGAGPYQNGLQDLRNNNLITKRN